uniref:Flocculation protein FLO11-like n=1 Tax=Angiostrongylus cantonensis TaxID=6313 RepID=A0A0K0DQU9_ANGCA
MKPGCAANYKGLNDCVDSPETSNDTDRTISVSHRLNHSTVNSTMNYSLSKTVQTAIADFTTTIAKPFVTESVQENTTPTTSTPSPAKTGQVGSDSLQGFTIELEVPIPSITSRNGISQKQSSSISTTQSVVRSTPQVGASKSLPMTTRFSLSTTTNVSVDVTTVTTTTTTIAPGTANHTQNISFLRDLFYARKQAEQQRLTTAEKTEITQLDTTTASSSIAVGLPIVLPKPLTFAEQRHQIGTESFILPASRNDQVQKSSKYNSLRKTSMESSQRNGEKIAPLSLISVHEVTTLAAKNREEEPKTIVPWWSAVVLGFFVSVITAWVVLFFLRKKKRQRANPVNESPEADKDPEDPLLKTTETSDSTSTNHKS